MEFIALPGLQLWFLNYLLPAVAILRLLRYLLSERDTALSAERTQPLRKAWYLDIVSILFYPWTYMAMVLPEDVGGTSIIPFIISVVCAQVAYFVGAYGRRFVRHYHETIVNVLLYSGLLINVSMLTSWGDGNLGRGIYWWFCGPILLLFVQAIVYRHRINKLAGVPTDSTYAENEMDSWAQRLQTTSPLNRALVYVSLGGMVLVTTTLSAYFYGGTAGQAITVLFQGHY